MVQLYDANNRPLESISGSQLVDNSTEFVFAGVDPGADIRGLKKPMPFTYKEAREMRKNPTIALARAAFSAPIAAGEWGVESTEDEPDEDMIAFVKEEIVDRRQDLIDVALKGIIDYGWSAFEKVFKIRSDGRFGYSKLKPLLHDLTSILIERDTGAFAGFRQGSTGSNQVVPARQVVIPLELSLLVPFQVEGTNWYGQGLLENAQDSWKKWKDSNNGAARYDAKVAGSHWVVCYPAKKSSKDATTGEIKSNFDIATAILGALESNGRVAIPSSPENVAGWSIELMSDKGKSQTSFVPRLEYLDRQIFRSFLIPERMVLEGRSGTRSDAGDHADVAITIMELVDKHITRLINWYALDPLLALNWGDEARGKVFLSSAPLVDEKRNLIEKIYMAILNNPVGFLEELDTLDTEVMKEKLGLPSKEPEELAEEAARLRFPEAVNPEDEIAASMGRIFAK